MEKLKKMVKTKVIAKLELHPINKKSELALESAFNETEKFIKACFQYYLGVLRARIGESYPALTKVDVNLLKRVANQMRIHLPSDTILQIIKLIYTNFKTSFENFGTYPRKITPFLPIRVSKITEKGKKYKRSLTIEEIKTADNSKMLACEISLGDRYNKRKATCYLCGKIDDEAEKHERALENVILALHGEGLWLGDPSTIVKRANRYFLHLSATKEAQVQGNPNRILGADLGISGPAVATFAVEFNNDGWKLLHSSLYRSGDYRKMWFSLLRKRSEKMSKAMQKEGVQKGQRFSEVTALGESLHSLRSREFVYFLVNKILEEAEKYDCRYIAIEKLSSFNYLIRGLHKHQKKLGKEIALHQRKHKLDLVDELLRKKRAVQTQIKLLNALPYGKFAEDIKNEAAWNGRKAILVNAAKTSITCPRCKYTSSKNREGNLFKCVECKFTMQADLLASLNIALKAREKLIS